MLNPKTKDDFEYQRYQSEISKNKYRCSCGHKEYIPPKLDKVICGWCGNYIFKDRKEEFKYRLKEKINRVINN